MTKSKLRAAPESHAIHRRLFQALKDLRSLSAKEMILLAEDLRALPTKPGSIQVKRLTTKAKEAVGMVYAAVLKKRAAYARKRRKARKEEFERKLPALRAHIRREIG